MSLSTSKYAMCLFVQLRWCPCDLSASSGK